MDDAAIRRERRRQKILEGGKNRLEQIQSTLYKQMPTAADADTPESTEPANKHDHKEKEVEETEPHPVKKESEGMKESPKSVDESSEPDEIDALIDEDQSSFVPQVRLSPADVLAMNEIDEQFRADNPESEEAAQNSATAESSQRQFQVSSLFTQKLVDLLISIGAGLLAFWSSLYMASTNMDSIATRTLLKQCMHPVTDNLKCQEFEWQQQGTSIIGVYIMVQLIVMSSKYLLSPNQQSSMGPFQALKQLKDGFAVFLVTFALAVTAL